MTLKKFLGLLFCLGLVVPNIAVGAERENSARKNKWSPESRPNDYVTALTLSPEAQQMLNGSPESLTLPTNAPNDAVLIFLAKKSEATNRDIRIARATAMSMIMRSDEICEAYMASFLTKTQFTRGGLRVASLAFSTAAGVTTPVRDANRLSALASLLSGSEEKLYETVLGKRAPELLYRSVMAIRTRERTKLLKILNDEEFKDIGPAMVIGQITDYHSQCGPITGLNGIDQSVQDAADTAIDKGTKAARDFLNAKPQQQEGKS